MEVSRFSGLFTGCALAYGSLNLPWLKDFHPVTDSGAPRISLLFAARDEEEKLPNALGTLAELDYPELEIIAVDDRSDGCTGRILDDFAAAHRGFPRASCNGTSRGWLGKPHALQQAYEASTGEWLLFTDADVRFKPDALAARHHAGDGSQTGSSVSVWRCGNGGLLGNGAVTFFGMAFHMATNPSGVVNPRSSTYMGVGAFQLLKRSAYEASGTHRRLAMEVIDDMKLGKNCEASRISLRRGHRARFCGGALACGDCEICSRSD